MQAPLPLVRGVEGYRNMRERRHDHGVAHGTREALPAVPSAGNRKVTGLRTCGKDAFTPTLGGVKPTRTPI